MLVALQGTPAIQRGDVPKAGRVCRWWRAPSEYLMQALQVLPSALDTGGSCCWWRWQGWHAAGGGRNALGRHCRFCHWQLHPSEQLQDTCVPLLVAMQFSGAMFLLRQAGLAGGGGR
jgi:hypothetical protein